MPAILLTEFPYLLERLHKQRYTFARRGQNFAGYLPGGSFLLLFFFRTLVNYGAFEAFRGFFSWKDDSAFISVFFTPCFRSFPFCFPFLKLFRRNAAVFSIKAGTSIDKRIPKSCVKAANSARSGLVLAVLQAASSMRRSRVFYSSSRNSSFLVKDRGHAWPRT